MLLIFPQISSAQSLRIDTVFNLSMRLNAGPALHFASISDPAGLTALPDNLDPYSASNGLSLGVGLAWDHRLDSSNILLGLAFGLHEHEVAFTQEENTIFTDMNGAPLPGVISHNLELGLRQIYLRPEAGYRISPNWNIRAGLELAFPISSSARHFQRIVSPPGREFDLTGSSELLLDSRDIPNVNALNLHAALGLSYDIPIDDLHAYVARPYVELSTSLFAPSNLDWNFADLRLGLEIVWTPKAPKFDVRDTVIIRDTTVRLTPDVADRQTLLISNRYQDSVHEDYSTRYTKTTVYQEYMRMLPQPNPLLSANIQARFVVEDGELAESAIVTVEETIEKNVINLLPYIFFEPQASSLPEKYQRLIPDEVQVFSVDALPKNSTLEVYYNLLNIIGYRMQRSPAAELVLTSCNDDPGTVRQKRSLAQQRNQSIISYLENAWNIDRSRFTTRLKRLPSRPSPSSTEIGRQENRRVELFSKDSSLLAPIIVRDTTRNADPSIIRFLPEVISEAGLAAWQIDIVSEVENSVINSIRGQNTAPTFVDWDFNNNDDVLRDGATAMRYLLIIEDFLGTRDSSNVETLLFEQIRPASGAEADVKINRYSLMSFDYNLFNLTEYHRRILQLVRSAATADSDINIIGSTDIVGDESYNLTLSRKRAETIADTLNLPTNRVVGTGEDALTFPNELPEGRFYSRRVDIILREEQ